MQQKSRHRKVQVRIFYPPEVPLESIDDRNDVDRHDMLEHDEPKPGTPHDSRDERTVDGEEVIHGAERIKSIGSLDLTFLMDNACVPIKIQKIEGIC
jgi:hypothetical protein